MKRENKKLVACMLCAAMFGSAVFCVPEFSASATESTTTESQTYEEWKESEPVNGSFEAGYEGMEVYGWSKTSMGNTNPDSKTGDYAKDYTLTTVVEEGNKVAALEKKGSGYVAATSGHILVSGSQNYRLSFDYKTASVSYKSGFEAGENGTTYFGIRLLVEEFDADGNSVLVDNKELTRYYADESNTNEWQTGVVEFTPQESTTSVVVYLWMGGQWNMYATVYFDDVTLNACDSNNIANGDFEVITYSALGGRDASTAGPLNWTSVSCEIAGAARSEDSYSSNYIISTEEDATGNHYMKIAPVDKTKGYILAQSNLISVSSRQHYTLSYDLKAEGSVSSTDYVPRLVVYYYDSDNKIISTTTKNHDYSIDDWATYTHAETVPDGAAYMTVNFYIGGRWNTDTAVHCIDNVSITERWTSETTQPHGTAPRTDGADYTGNYSMTTVDAGDAHASALKLYITRSGGGYGAAVYFSDPIDVKPNIDYKTTYDLKIENLTDNTKTTGASYMVRYIKEDGSYVMNGSDFATELNGHPKQNQDWTSYEHTFTVPEDAVQLQFGMLIGVGTMNSNEGMMFYYDNITLAEVIETISLENDLLFVMLEEGNAIDATDETSTIDVRDLIRMKKYTVDSTIEILDTADMNKNGTVNSTDMKLLCWKLLGVTTTELAGKTLATGLYQ